jgi:glycine betaine/proline transport system substrate-binding protein
MKLLTSRTRRVLVAVAVTAALTTTAACASSDSAGGSGDGVELKIGQFNWTAAAVETEIITAIAEDHPDLGVSSIEPVKIDPAPGWVGLGRGDIDVLPEVNLPNQQQFADKNEKTTELLGETYGGAAQGWFVPKYLTEPGGAAEGLTSIDQLADESWAKKVGGTLYDADPGWVTSQQNTDRIKAFDLKVEQKNSSEAALIAQLKRAYDRKEPILIYFYRPHWLFTQFDLVQLEEPKPYEDDCFVEGGRSDCAIPTLAAWIAARKDLAERAPKFAAALKNVKIPLEDIETLLAENEDKGTEPAELARQWVDEHKAEVDQWVG